MKNFGRYIAIAAVVSPLTAAMAAEPTSPTACAPPPPPALAREFQLGGPLAYPTFCAIPPTPTNVPAAGTFRAEVVDTRLAGAWLEGQTGPQTWSLTRTEDFQSTAVREAAPPPPMTPPGEADTEAFVAKAKAKATPPHKPH
ncbi:MAG TPA: hypothetical protein VG166_05920 [Caulobacteraceae bacterium]|jgi:hypothetical protein|nr:hypothetical protein [Caulobacteraceae bacterium]